MKFAKDIFIACLMLLASVASAADTASVSGKVTLEGEAPKTVALKTDFDKKCATMHGGNPIYSDDVLVGEGGGLKNAFVYVTAGLEGKTFEAPAEAAKLDQIGCVYTPHVQGVMVGQTLSIVNSDETMHNIRCFGKVNRAFNIGQPTPGTRDKKFTEVEPAIKFKCDMHPWMTAYIFALDHPFFAVSDDKGSYEIKGLPAGKYTITIWHEKYGEQTAEITVAGGETKDQAFKFSTGK